MITDGSSALELLLDPKRAKWKHTCLLKTGIGFKMTYGARIQRHTEQVGSKKAGEMESWRILQAVRMHI